jgi:hypothetical protein
MDKVKISLLNALNMVSANGATLKKMMEKEAEVGASVE